MTVPVRLDALSYVPGNYMTTETLRYAVYNSPVGGSILSIGFEKIYLMQNSINTPVSEVISTYVYKIGVLQFNYSYSTAVGLFNSLVNLAMLLIVNTLSDRISKVSVL